MKNKDYKFRQVVLVENKTIVEKIILATVKFIGYFFGYIIAIPSLLFQRSSLRDKAWKIQNTSYVENGETIYCRAPPLTPKINKIIEYNSVREAFHECIKENGAKRCLGRRIIKKSIDDRDKEGKPINKVSLSDYEWITFNQAHDTVIKTCFFLKKIGVSKEDKILIFAETSYDWMIMALSAIEIGSTFVTVYPTLTDDYIIDCIKLTQPVLAFVDPKTLKRLESFLTSTPSVIHVICSCKCAFETLPKDSKLVETVDIYHFDHLSDKYPISSLSAVPNQDKTQHIPDINDVVVIMFTSGTTGTPKGVIMKNINILSILRGIADQEDYWRNQVYPAYLPLSHVLELLCEFAILFLGGSIGYCNPLTLFDTGPMLIQGCKGDLSVLKPTVMAAVPLVLDRMMKTSLDLIKSQSRIKMIIFEAAYQLKAHFHSKGISTPVLNKIIFNKFKNFLGGNIRYGIVGGAYLMPSTEEFINICFATFKQAYGSTETCCGGTFSNIDYVRPNNCGPPFGCSELKIVPWVEGGYNTVDKDHLKGELVINGPNVCVGYYLNEELTQQSFKIDEKSGKLWFYTGDIVQLLEDGTFRIIGRKSEVIKLSHGEYIELTKVESTLSSNRYIDMICVAPTSNFSELVAIVSLNHNNVIEGFKSLNLSPNNSFEEIIDNHNIIDLIEKSISETARSMGLSKFEIPRKFALVKETWTPETGLVTPSMKIKRIEITKKYKKFLE